MYALACAQVLGDVCACATSVDNVPREHVCCSLVSMQDIDYVNPYCSGYIPLCFFNEVRPTAK